MVVDCFANGTYQLANLDGDLHDSRVNGLRLKPYHARLVVVKDKEMQENIVPVEESTSFDAEAVQMLFGVAADHE